MIGAYINQLGQTMISKFSKNNMGTVSFDARFAGMRKAQDFIVYPMNSEGQQSILIQSDTRIGKVNLQTGAVVMSKPRAGGAYQIHLYGAQMVETLSGEELLTLKANIMSTASGKAGANGIVYCDNSSALEVFA